jgi:hypothetical protein
MASGGDGGCGQERGHGDKQLLGERSPMRLDQLDDGLGVTCAEPRPSGRCGHAWPGSSGRPGDRSEIGRLDRRRGRDRRDRRFGGHRTSHGPKLGNRDAGLRPGSRRRRRELEHRPRLRGAGRRDHPERRRRRRGCGSRGRRRCGSRGRGRDRRLARRGRRHRERRQETERVEVALRVAAEPDAELDVRDRMGRHAARADDRDRLALGHDRAAADQE